MSENASYKTFYAWAEAGNLWQTLWRVKGPGNEEIEEIRGFTTKHGELKIAIIYRGGGGFQIFDQSKTMTGRVA